MESLKCERIEITPNSGHHYYFLPFSRAMIARFGGVSGELSKRCRGNQAPWQPCHAESGFGESPAAASDPAEMETQPFADIEECREECADAPEKAAPPCPAARWIRYRYGYKGSRANIGLWIAVESNLGDVTRGTLLGKAREPVAPKNVPAPELRKKSPYRYSCDEQVAPNHRDRDRFRIHLDAIKGQEVSIPLEIVWSVAPNPPIDVDIVVDFGNTRTVVLAVEHNRHRTGDGRLSSICKNILFLPRGEEYPDPDQLVKDKRDGSHQKYSIADSWFLLQEPQFSEWDYPDPEGMGATPFEPMKDYDSETKVFKKYAGLMSETREIHYLTQRVPQMFVEISPVMMGAEARELFHNIDLTRGVNISMSSPKRYLWDQECIGKHGGDRFWNLNENPWTQYRPLNTLNLLHGQICRYMYKDGRYWDINKPPFLDPEELAQPPCFPRRPGYPRSSAMVWSALSILENAYRQVTSTNWRKNDGPGSNRRIRRVHVTYPSGWIAREKEYYRRAWQQAVNIFTLSHMEHSTPFKEGEARLSGRPELHLKLDEAVASQLPFVYSEIRRLGGNANRWIQLYGRRTETPPPTASRRPATAQATGNSHLDWHLRVMTIDIGGGTSDTTIVEYANKAPNATVSLEYKVLFRDCCSFAGDAVAKAIIERVLLPALLEAREIEPHSDISYDIANALAGTRVALGDTEMWQRVVSLFFLPVVRQWLTDIVACENTGGIYVGEDGSEGRSLRECGVDGQIIDQFNTLLSQSGITDPIADPEIPLRYDPEDINDCIRHVLTSALEPLGKFIAAYDVDVVTLSGKISEIPVVFDLLCEYLPIRPQRIVRMKNFLAGDWYPMTHDGKHIHDAKSVTAVGTALFAASWSHLLGANWSIHPDPQQPKQKPIPNYWVMMPDSGDRRGGTVLLSNTEDSNEHKIVPAEEGEPLKGDHMNIGSYIGRQKYNSEYSTPEQQYQLVWTGEDKDAPQSHLAVCIHRRPNAENDDDIELGEVAPTSLMDAGCDMSKVKLRLKTLPPSGFWMEEARFDMWWKKEH